MSDDGYFSEAVAKTYDEVHGRLDPALIHQTVEVLYQLAEGKAVLEFAIGTGRIALPLCERGCPVTGVELSRSMVAELTKKKAVSGIKVHIGDMTTTRVEGKFSLVFLVFNTIDNLTTQEAQIACFRNAAEHLQPGGRFLIETQVPPIQTLPFGESLSAFACSPRHMGVDDIDIATQCYTSNHVWIDGDSMTSLTIPFRYVWPSELDLMAKLARLELEHRWSDWGKSPFDRLSKSHISVWRKT
ncbi:MAG: class I SAM-dependent methyltransferase [Alphaproteobacteria bacterium]|jgi:SAM-dependent methyltransferase|nr:class I SAM-dependent methyltransferase [Alphaproteobacteria bacterium]MBU1551218.1 class I SAM-dependent methyltransferase [Alphaproteobacteria bacterium]MBU2334847.1 class I SAM-dependent methyltransferase [Alphaproteobacteria bacterium]MBU2389350.1 class I SAM-dependent methyltransferase [Alphaproteobacteria bacterium]